MPESHSAAQIPRWMWPFLTGPSGAFTQFGQAQGALPSLTDLATNAPALQIPDLSPDQMALLSQLEQSGVNNPDMAQARAQLQQLTSGPIGSSPATQAGMKAFSDITMPQIMQAESLQGTAGGGAALEAASQGATAAAVPLIQQEIQNRAAAPGEWASLGNQSLQQIAMALEAAGLPREIAQQQAQAQFDQQQQEYQFAAGLQSQPLGLLGNFFGQRNWSTMTGEDIGAGIGKGLSPSGIFGGGGK